MNYNKIAFRFKEGKEGAFEIDELNASNILLHILLRYIYNYESYYMAVFMINICEKSLDDENLINEEDRALLTHSFKDFFQDEYYRNKI